MFKSLENEIILYLKLCLIICYILFQLYYYILYTIFIYVHNFVNYMQINDYLFIILIFLIYFMYTYFANLLKIWFKLVYNYWKIKIMVLIFSKDQKDALIFFIPKNALLNREFRMCLYLWKKRVQKLNIEQLAKVFSSNS